MYHNYLLFNFFIFLLSYFWIINTVLRNNYKLKKWKNKRNKRFLKIICKAKLIRYLKN